MTTPKRLEEVRRVYFGYAALAYRDENSETYHPGCPWRFEIHTPEGDVRRFMGIPNYVDTCAQALKRAWWRCKWLADGSFHTRYSAKREP